MSEVVIDYAALSDQRNASVLSTEYLRLLASRDALPNHPALMKIGSPSSVDGSTTVKVPKVGIDGYDGFADGTDGGNVESIGITDGNVTVTCARKTKSYTPTDLAQMTDKQGIFTFPRLAQDALITSGTYLVEAIAALLPGFSATVGTSGVAGAVQVHLDAKRRLNRANAEGGLLAIYHTDQWADILDDLLLNVGGNIAWIPASAELIAVLGNGYQGKLAGVDVFTTTRVNTANADADFCGGMFARGAVLWTDATPPVVLPTQQTLVGGKVLFELDRHAKTGTTDFVSHYYVGATEGIDEAGVGIITKKP